MIEDLPVARTSLLCMFLGLVVVPGALFAAEELETRVVDSSHALPDGERVLELSIVVPASVDEVWDTFTTSEGFASWAVPVAEVDFRLGGIIESSYDLDAEIGAPGNIENEIVAYAPRRMLAIRNVEAPSETEFDVETFQRLHTVYLFEAVDPEATRVTVVQPGYRQGEVWDQVYRQFEWGIRWSLEKLEERFRDGPIDWRKAAAEVEKKSSGSR